MADHSSFMDWAPPTPEPVRDPYPTDYIPGGWPVESPPISTTGVFAARRPPPFRLLPAAKRLCQGLGAAVALGYSAATSFSRYTVHATTTIVTVPAYAIVRQVNQRRRGLGRPHHARRQITQRLPLPESPWNRAVAIEVERPRWEPPAWLTAPALVPAIPQVTAALTPAPTPHPLTQKTLYHVPDLMPRGISKTTRSGRKVATRLRQRQFATSPVFADMPRFSPPRSPKITQLQLPSNIERPHTPLPSIPRLEDTAIPQLNPLLATPPTPPTSSPSSSPSPSPGDQLQQELDAAREPDSDASSTFSSSWRAKTRRTRKRGAPDEDTPTVAQRPQVAGPSLPPPQTPTPTADPTPVIVVQGTTTAVTADARSAVDPTLLSPPRIKRRRVSTPISSRTRKAVKGPATPQTPESDISSTCDCSLGIISPSDTKQTILLDKSDISSAYHGTPPDLAEDARLFGMILAGGGSPTPGADMATMTNEKTTITKLTNGEVTPQDTSDQPAQNGPTEAEAESEPGTTTKEQTFVSESSETTTNEQTSTSESSETSTKEQTSISESNETITKEQTLIAESSKTTTKEQTSISESSKQTNDTPVERKDSSGLNDSDTSTSDPKTPERQAQPPDKQTTNANGSPQHGPASIPAAEQQLAQLSLADPYTPDQPTPKAITHSAEKMQRVTRAESKRLQQLEEAQHYEIIPLAEEWEKKVLAGLRAGHGEYKATDLTRVVPLAQGRGTDNWLNDEVINGYLKLIVAHGKRNDRPTQVPTHHAFVSFFYNNLESRGYEGVKRWASRAKIGGKNLLETENVFIPVNSGMHWTLCVVSGKHKTITHYNSLGGNGRRYAETVKKWVIEELGSAYREGEWKVDYVGETPQQENMDDCGVFTITNARQIMLGLTPMSYTAGQIRLQRRRIVAELIHGGLIKSTTD